VNTPNDLFYSETHEWVRLNDDGTVTVGITDHAQEQLGEVKYSMQIPLWSKSRSL